MIWNDRFQSWLVVASWRWFRLIRAGGDKMMDGARGLCFSNKKTDSELFLELRTELRLCFLCAVVLFFSIAPRFALHGLHELTRFSGESSPPSSTGTRWSASVAGLPHQWHWGLVSSSLRRADA
jgi:hypothetical protein